MPRRTRHVTRHTTRRIVALLAIVVAVSVLALDALAGAATPPVGKRGIDVVQIEGYLDAPNVSLILDRSTSPTPGVRRC